MLLPYGEYFNDYVNMDLGVFEGVEFNEMVNKGRRVCRFCAGGVGLWKSDMPGSLAIGARHAYSLNRVLAYSRTSREDSSCVSSRNDLVRRLR